MCFQFTHFLCDDCENIYTLFYYHHQIGRLNYYTLFRVRSWNNGMRWMCFCILMFILHMYIRMHVRPSCLSWYFWILRTQFAQLLPFCYCFCTRPLIVILGPYIFVRKNLECRYWCKWCEWFRECRLSHLHSSRYSVQLSAANSSPGTLFIIQPPSGYQGKTGYSRHVCAYPKRVVIWHSWNLHGVDGSEYCYQYSSEKSLQWIVIVDHDML